MIINNQHGFRVGHSCTTQQLELMEDFTDYFELGIPYDCIYLDFAKAFDSVPHQRLLTKVNDLGLQGELLYCIKDFLTGRKQRVMVNNTCSEWSDVTSGIPQGSVLGSILFLAYINDIVNGIQSNIKIFADDTKLYNSVNNYNILQEDLLALSKWSDQWLLLLMLTNVKYCIMVNTTPTKNIR